MRMEVVSRRRKEKGAEEQEMMPIFSCHMVMNKGHNVTPGHRAHACMFTAEEKSLSREAMTVI